MCQRDYLECISSKVVFYCLTLTCPWNSGNQFLSWEIWGTMNAIYVGWPRRPLGRTENFGVSPVPPFWELKRLCKPLQKVFVQDAHATSRQEPADKQARPQRSLTTCSSSQGARAWSRTCCPQCAPWSEPSDRPGEGGGATVGAAGRLDHRVF